MDQKLPSFSCLTEEMEDQKTQPWNRWSSPYLRSQRPSRPVENGTDLRSTPRKRRKCASRIRLHWINYRRLIHRLCLIEENSTPVQFVGGMFRRKRPWKFHRNWPRIYRLLFHWLLIRLANFHQKLDLLVQTVGSQRWIISYLCPWWSDFCLPIPQSCVHFSSQQYSNDFPNLRFVGIHRTAYLKWKQDVSLIATSQLA